MPIISLPLTNQLTNGTTADGGQVLADLNAIASAINALCAKNGVNSDITQLTALVAVPSGVTASGWTITNPTINSPTITGGTAAGISLDSASTGVTAPNGTNNTGLATNQFVGLAVAAAGLPNVIDPSWIQYGINLGLRSCAYAQ